jgi:hypothetical protein
MQISWTELHQNWATNVDGRDKGKGKIKAIPLQALTGQSRQSAHEGGKVVSSKHRSPLPPRNYSWYSFLLEAKSTNVQGSPINSLPPLSKVHVRFSQSWFSRN